MWQMINSVHYRMVFAEVVGKNTGIPVDAKLLLISAILDSWSSGSSKKCSVPQTANHLVLYSYYCDGYSHGKF